MEFACPCFASCIWHLDAYKILIASTPTAAVFFQKTYLTEALKESNTLQMLRAQGQQKPSSLKSILYTTYSQ